MSFTSTFHAISVPSNNIPVNTYWYVLMKVLENTIYD